MKVVKKIIQWFVIILILLNAAILISGRTYLYKGVWNTYLKGRSGPSIYEYKIFNNREVKTGTVQDWAIGKDYNKVDIPQQYKAAFKRYTTVAYLIVKDDSIRYEQYWAGAGKDSHTNSFSMAKSIVSILTGIAIDDGKIKSVNEHVSDFIPQYKKGMDSLLTIKDLLTMSSGINFDESYKSPFAYPAQAYYGTDIKTLTLKYKVTKQPGKVFHYRSGNTELLSFILEKAVGMHLSDYASLKLWQPIGAKNPAYWSLDHKGGVEKAYCCFNSDARDFARLGKLYLDSGRWNGKQLVSQDYVLKSIQPANLVDKNGDPNTNYGYSWWLYPFRGHHVFYARGLLGQRIMVIPDEKMIVIRLGNKREVEDAHKNPLDIKDFLGAALDMYGDKK